MYTAVLVKYYPHMWVAFVFVVHQNPVVLTLYNPYNLNLRFVVLSTNPSVVAVTPARGNLTRQSSVQLIVKARPSQAFNQPNSQLINQNNQIALRVDLTNDRDEVVGQQTLPVKNLPSFGQSIEQANLPQIKTRDNIQVVSSHYKLWLVTKCSSTYSLSDCLFCSRYLYLIPPNHRYLCIHFHWSPVCYRWP